MSWSLLFSLLLLLKLEVSASVTSLLLFAYQHSFFFLAFFLFIHAESILGGIHVESGPLYLTSFSSLSGEEQHAGQGTSHGFAAPIWVLRCLLSVRWGWGMCVGMCLGCKALSTGREEGWGLRVAELPLPCGSKGVLAAEALWGSRG